MPQGDNRVCLHERKCSGDERKPPVEGVIIRNKQQNYIWLSEIHQNSRMGHTFFSASVDLYEDTQGSTSPSLCNPPELVQRPCYTSAAHTLHHPQSWNGYTER